MKNIQFCCNLLHGLCFSAYGMVVENYHYLPRKVKEKRLRENTQTLFTYVLNLVYS